MLIYISNGGNIGKLNFNKDEVTYDIYPISGAVVITRYGEREINYMGISNGFQALPGNCLVSVKVHNDEMNWWWIFKFEATEEVAESMFARINRFVDVSQSNSCFIATAVYKDENCNELVILRNWRDEYLRKTIVGRKFINYYYKNGEQIASYVKKSLILSTTIRLGLNVFIYLLNSTVFRE